MSFVDQFSEFFNFDDRPDVKTFNAICSVIEQVLLERALISCQGFCKSITAQVQVNIKNLAEKISWFPSVFRWILNLQVVAFRPAKLLQVEVEHGTQAVYDLRPHKRFLYVVLEEEIFVDK